MRNPKDNLSRGLRSLLSHTRRPSDIQIHRAKKRLKQYQDVWNEAMSLIKSRLKNYCPKVPAPEETECTAVIVEPRVDVTLEWILKDYLYFLDKNKWSLHIFYGCLNEHLVHQITKDWGKVKLISLGVNNLTIPEYSQLLKSSSFWQSIVGEKVLIFQTDSLLLRPGLEKFLEYDYIGAPWKVAKGETEVGNGGLSLRSRRAMLQVSLTQPELLKDQTPEDIFFANHLLRLGFRVATRDLAKQFSVESIFNPSPIGVHRPLKLPIHKFREIMNGLRSTLI